MLRGATVKDVHNRALDLRGLANTDANDMFYLKQANVGRHRREGGLKVKTPPLIQPLLNDILNNMMQADWQGQILNFK